ncbi:MAG: ATP-binding cassette domain-containing protein [Hyphomonadaceae bacterium]|nr:ATP-binding cassette domain-containing protein [Hyphomonadaceae bacterium]
MLTLDSLEIRLGPQRRLQPPDWSLPAGATALLVGPSGSGKSTLLNVAAGLLAPAAGRVLVDGVDIAALKPAARDRFRGARIGVVFQSLRLVQALSVADNLALALALAGRKPDPARIRDTLARLGLAALARRRPRALSIGEMQRAAIARAVIARPTLILADEPTSALDDANAEAAFALLRAEAQACGASLLIATHDARLTAHGLPTLTLAGPP